MNQPQTLLVTGGCGFIGSTFIRQRVTLGDTVIILDALTYAGHRENIQGVSGPGKVQLEVGNIIDEAFVKSLFSKYAFSGVVNFAAESHVDRSITGPSAFIETNILGTFNLLRHSLDFFKTLSPAKQKTFRYLQVSTDEVYGSLGETGFFSEKTSYAPNSPYSASKASADFLARAWFHTYGLPTVTTNCSNNYGPRQFPEKLIPLMINHAVAGKNLPVYGNGKNVRDWIHVEDHCQGISLALEKGDPGKTYCFGGSAERKNLDVVNLICKELDLIRPKKTGESYSQQITFVEDRLGHDWRYAIDDTVAQTTLGFKRKYTFESGLKQTILWYLDNGPWCDAVVANAASAMNR